MIAVFSCAMGTLHGCTQGHEGSHEVEGRRRYGDCECVLGLE